MAKGVPGERDHDVRLLLQATAQAVPAGDAKWQLQLELLRSAASFDPDTQTWSRMIGALDDSGLRDLQTLYDTAAQCGTAVTVRVVRAPEYWHGPTFGADALGDQEPPEDPAEKTRALGQLLTPNR